MYHSFIFKFFKFCLPIFETYDFVILQNKNILIIYIYNDTYSYIFTINQLMLKSIHVLSDSSFIMFSLLKQHYLFSISQSHVCSIFRALIRFTVLTISASGRFYRWPRLRKERTHNRADFFIGDVHLTHHMFLYKYDVRLARRKFYTSHFIRFSRRRVRLATFDFGLLKQYAQNVVCFQPANIFTNRGLIIHGMLRRQKKGKIEKFY